MFREARLIYDAIAFNLTVNQDTNSTLQLRLIVNPRFVVLELEYGPGRPKSNHRNPNASGAHTELYQSSFVKSLTAIAVVRLFTPLYQNS